MWNAADEAWGRYMAASTVQMHVVAALDGIPDIEGLEEQMDQIEGGTSA